MSPRRNRDGNRPVTRAGDGPEACQVRGMDAERGAGTEWPGECNGIGADPASARTAAPRGARRRGGNGSGEEDSQ